MNLRRIGFACQFMAENQTKPTKIDKELQNSMNNKTVRLNFLENQTKSKAQEKLWTVITHNIKSVGNLIKYVSSLEDNLKMLRISSELLPGYTSQWNYFYKLPDVVTYCSKQLGKIGQFARDSNVRLSMHPGPFTVLASQDDAIVKKSIQEIQYHADIIRWLGYGLKFQDFKCNVHIAGKRGPQGIISVLPKLSPQARNTLTIQNDQFSWGIDASLELKDHVALVLDIHHHWINSLQYIQAQDYRFKKMLESWRGVRPVIHYSTSREQHVERYFPEQRPDMTELKKMKMSRVKLRAHSDYCWNRKCNQWALSFWKYADIMVQAKKKNLASRQLFEQAKELGLVESQSSDLKK